MDFLTGFFSNAIAIVVVQPMDVIKSRYQINQSKSNSVNKIVSDVWKIHGIRGFYRGVLPKISTYTIFWAIFFQVKQIDIKITENVFLNKFATSFVAGNVASTFTNPLFVLKTRFQVKNDSKMNIIKDLNKNKLNYFKGLTSTYINNLKLGLQFQMYDYFKSKTENVVFSSFTSKFICSSLFYPMDLIGVTQRSSNEKLTIKKISMDIYKTGGIKGFYRGLVLYNSVSLINFTIMMSLLEFLTKKKKLVS